jgi:hypothetical protein
MKKIVKIVAINIAGFLLSSGSAVAADMGSLTISSPQNGSIVVANTMLKLTYNVKLGPEGNHLHIYVDDQKPIVVRNVAGCPCTVDLPALSVGKHVILIDEARADHSLTGVKSSIVITAK